ncbi:hypothetical protein PQX77_001042 [Marasmius sp. AFHP31]|nr:hypothetical protein PQX77_001042 [Marasmius sp. AFHP31]
MKAAEEHDLEQAIRMSEEEEAKRNKAVEDSNASALFDDQNQISSPNPAQFSNNPFPMTTLSDPTPYTVGLQPQYTQVQPQYTQMQPQFTGYNPFQLQMQQEAAQADFLRQQEAFQQQQAQQQQEEWMRQQMLLQQQQQQQQQQQLQQMTFTQSLAPQPTGFGSNNPFAPRSTPTPTSPVTDSQKPSFDIRGTYDRHNQLNDLSSTSSFSSPTPSTIQTPPSQNQGNRPVAVKPNPHENQELADLFANRDGGQDTFGNVGTLRYGHSEAGRLLAQQSTPTGNQGRNPFAKPQTSSEQPFFSI